MSPHSPKPRLVHVFHMHNLVHAIATKSSIIPWHRHSITNDPRLIPAFILDLILLICSEPPAIRGAHTRFESGAKLSQHGRAAAGCNLHQIAATHRSYCVALWPLSVGSNLSITSCRHIAATTCLVVCTMLSAICSATCPSVSYVINAGSTSSAGDLPTDPRVSCMNLRHRCPKQHC